MNLASLNSIAINPTERRSINYAKARAAIEQACTNRKEVRQAKQVIIDHLMGNIERDDGSVVKGVNKTVVFPDGSKARY